MKNDNIKKIRWGIIGLGNIAAKFATDLAKLENVTLVAVASRNPHKAAEFAAQHHSQKAYNSYDELLKDPEVDAVYIATPHSFHKEHTMLCLQNKKAVLCEKPLAMNASEVLEMIALAKENNVLLMEALWTAFLPHFIYIVALVESEKFGKLKNVDADFGFLREFDNENRLFKKALGGGSLLDIGIYPVFAALATLGTPNTIDAKATFFENGADSSCAMIFHYENAKATLKSTLMEETKTEAVFKFDKAIVKINGQFHEPSTVMVSQNNKEELINFNYKTIGYNYEAEHFSQLLRENKTESKIMSFDRSLKIIQTLDKVREIIGLQYGS
ncbi:Predicted dehydrogenase [Polaribacter irgensii 23-P]|uniref:Predicted dehydrogenase n=1 Tax=Polaribacter irgensii 23-P TaxID=313594 RepID=A4BZS3_9FLAO|nr:Gfo/Idh/MocA family oxidoreductase [Polaribacter irgensii]EAR12666.1 Predicted dehydrogenase [Polaribacter irgensii 23-P]